MTEVEFRHSEDDVKTGDKLIAFLKSEVDKQIARARLFESRSQTMATFAGASGTLVAALKPASLSLLSLVLLSATAFLTLRVLFLAFKTHSNRPTGVTSIQSWEYMKSDIWNQEITPMEVVHRIQDSYIDDFKDVYNLANDKAKVIEKMEPVLRWQFVFTVLTMLSFVLPGVMNESKAATTATTTSQPAAIEHHTPSPTPEAKN